METRQSQTMELRQMGDGITEVTRSYTHAIPQGQLSDELGMMGFGLAALMGGGEWFGEFMMLGFFATDLEFEVGSSMQTFDGARLRVIEKQTVAGVEGYFVTRSLRQEDDEGNRLDVLTSEWVIAPNVGWPLLVRVYQDGQLTYVMELVEYTRE
jgi:hypothetical protein